MAFRVGRAVLELSLDGGAFVRGVGDAKATMRDLARGIQQTQRDIGKQAFQFGGRQQIADANKLAEAISRVGGASRLTAAEQARVNAQVRDAIEKYRVLGERAPASLIKLEQQTRRVTQATDKMAAGMAAMGAMGRKAFENAQASDRMIAGMGAAGKATQAQAAAATTAGLAVVGFGGATQMATRALGGYLSVTAIVGAIRRTLEYGDALQKASVAAGATATQVQRLENIAVSGNTSLESLIRALTTMQDRVSGQDPSAMNALKELRLNAEALLALGPDEQIIAIAKALQQIASHERRIKLGKDVFGPATVEIFGALSQNVDEAKDSVIKLSDEGVAKLANLQAGFERALLAARRFGAYALSVYTAQIRVQAPSDPNRPVEPARLISPGGADRIILPPNYANQLRDAQAALKGLNKETLAQLDSAKKLQKDDAALAEILKRVGVEGDHAKNVIKLLSGELKEQKKDVSEAKREWQQLLERFNGANQRLDAQKIAAAIATGQLDLKRMTVEAQQEISKALADGAEAWKTWGGVVPSEINRARAAVATLSLMVAELRALETPPPFAPVPEGDAAIAQGLHDLDMTRAGGFVEGMKTRAAGARDHNKVLRDLDIARSEAVIRQAEREGAKKVQILVMESMVAQKKRDAELVAAQDAMAADEDALQERRRRGELETVQFEAELQRRQQAHQDHVTEINEQWAIAEAERRDMIRRESSFWASELGKRITGELRGALHEATGRLFTTFFTGADAEAKKQAKAAREDYERIANSGKASAEEITRAFRAMREAEEAANIGWANRFKSIWDGIQRHVFKVFDAILEEFVNGLLKGMVRSFLGTSLGQRIGGWLGMGGGGGGSVFDLGGGLLGKVPGLGGLLGGGAATTAFSTTAGGTLAASMFAPSVAAAAVPTAITSAGVSAGVAAGTGAAVGGGAAAAGTAAGAAGGSGAGATLAAFATNPVTIGAAVAIGAVLLLKKLGVFDNSPGALSYRIVRNFREAHPERPKTTFETEWERDHPDAARNWEEGRARREDERRRRLGAFHTGGVIGDTQTPTTPADRLTSKEVLIKVLKGESVLTEHATAAVGGKAGVDALNRGGILSLISRIIQGRERGARSQMNALASVGRLQPPPPMPAPKATEAGDTPPVIDLISAGKHRELFDAIARKEIGAGEAIAAFIRARGDKGGLGGVVSGGSLKAGAFSNVMAMPAPVPFLTPAVDRALQIPDILRARTGVTAAPAQPRSDARADTRPIVVNNYFQPKGVLDSGSIREIHQKHIVPMTEEAIRTGRLGAVVQKRALE